MKIGVFGGSFDPVHNGHLHIARRAREAAGLDRVLFMPAYIQPFKREKTMSAGDVRVEMLHLATADEPAFAVTDAELRAKGVSYTILSLRAVRDECPPDTELFFILGADMLMMIDRWHRADELLREFPLIVGLRPGSDADAARAHAAWLAETRGARVTCMRNEETDVSSSRIRETIARGEDAAGALPARVAAYIHENGLYENGQN